MQDLTEEQRKTLLRAALEQRGASSPPWQPKPTAEGHYSTLKNPNSYLASVAGALASDDWQELRFEQPTRTPTAQGDVLVPLAQAGISGLLAGVLSGVVLLATEAGVSAWIPAAIGAAVGGFVWAKLLVDHRRLLRSTEVWTRRDKDPIAAQPQGIRLEVKRDRGPDIGPGYLFAELPTTAQAFRTWAQGVTGGRSLAQSAWTGKGRPFSRSDYEELLAFLERARVVRWVNPDAPAQGRELTRMGQEALAAYLRSA
jgi:hypothetical protein